MLYTDPYDNVYYLSSNAIYHSKNWLFLCFNSLTIKYECKNELQITNYNIKINIYLKGYESIGQGKTYQ